MTNKLRRFCLFLLLFAALPMVVLAREADPEELGSITMTLQSRDGADAMEGAEISLFYVASAQTGSDGSLRFIPAGDFTGCDIGDPDLIQTLDAFVSEHPADCRKTVTDSRGRAFFGDLPQGLYFVKQTGEALGFAECAPFLVTIPMETQDGYILHVDATPKTDVTKLIDLTIRKVWNTDGSKPGAGHVTVQLLRGETVVDTVVLNGNNDWQYTCTDMPESDAYRIREVDVPKGFAATYSRSGYLFTVTNTTTLAQTGQIIWPIPVFAMAGLVFLTMGFVILRKPVEEHA